jgi:hypothetical protein
MQREAKNPTPMDGCLEGRAEGEKPVSRVASLLGATGLLRSNFRECALRCWVNREVGNKGKRKRLARAARENSHRILRLARHTSSEVPGRCKSRLELLPLTYTEQTRTHEGR